jgi:hypothetical protein
MPGRRKKRWRGFLHVYSRWGSCPTLPYGDLCLYSPHELNTVRYTFDEFFLEVVIASSISYAIDAGTTVFLSCPPAKSSRVLGHTLKLNEVS